MNLRTVVIAFGPSDGAADTGIMMQYGSPRWIMITFGLLGASLGLYLWNRQGQHFGLGEAKGVVSRKATIASAVLLVAIVGIELMIGSK